MPTFGRQTTRLTADGIDLPQITSLAENNGVIRTPCRGVDTSRVNVTGPRSAELSCAACRRY